MKKYFLCIAVILFLTLGLTGCKNSNLSGTYIPVIDKSSKNYALSTPTILSLYDEGIQFQDDGTCNVIGRNQKCFYKYEKGKYKVSVEEVIGNLELEFTKSKNDTIKDNYNYYWNKSDEVNNTKYDVSADKIYNITMHVYLDENGNANITEIWDVKAYSGSEWYKQFYNMGNQKVSDFKVYMDDVLLKSKDWNINENITQKRGYYGINNVDEGIELCFGKGDMNRHIFKLTYSLSNIIFNVSDAQVLYQTFLPNVSLDNFSVTIDSFYEFSNDLNIWKYGYQGVAYVKNGKIEVHSNDIPLNNEYVVLLAKIPVNTFKTNNSDSRFNNFDEVLTNANGFKLTLTITNE